MEAAQDQSDLPAQPRLCGSDDVNHPGMGTPGDDDQAPGARNDQRLFRKIIGVLEACRVSGADRISRCTAVLHGGLNLAAPLPPAASVPADRENLAGCRTRWRGGGFFDGDIQQDTQPLGAMTFPRGLGT